jgi:electron transport complex protein RnfB
MADEPRQVDRRGFVGDSLRIAGVFGLGGLAGAVGRRRQEVWQIDPDKCMACGNCETHCVLDVSAVKCIQCFQLCGYCDICTGYFPPNDFRRDTSAENHLCPTGAIERKFVEEQAGVRYFEYTIDEPICIGCGKCVEGCDLMNGSLYLQVSHELCLDCNECSIAVACPTEAFVRVPIETPTLLRQKARAALENRAAQLAGRQPEDLSPKKAEAQRQTQRQIGELLAKDARSSLQPRADAE